ncbi:MAG TPA: hypothetical protein VGD62_00465 [Acidobacteriaceae bacterium]
MLPSSLKADSFERYPPDAARLALAHLEVLQRLPLAFLPSLLRELIDYDARFPAERASIDAELAHLSSLTPAQSLEWLGAFSQLRLSPALEHSDWVNQPGLFLEQLSAYLWSTHQLDAFRAAATAYGDRLSSALPAQPPPLRRLGIAILGQGVASYDSPLFANLREHGTYFHKVIPDRGLEKLLQVAASRAQAHPISYAHWYVDGGDAASSSPLLTTVSYTGLEPARNALLRNMQSQISKPGMGPEELRTHLAQLSPRDLGMAGDPLLQAFQLKLLTEGSGTQIFSTTFAQWAAREVLRRAQALTLVVRFAPRQRQRPMNELLSSQPGKPELDPVGSIIDADMAAYYQWINQQRLPGSDRSSFLAWFEGHSDAILIGPSIARGAESNTALPLDALLALATG